MKYDNNFLSIICHQHSSTKSASSTDLEAPKVSLDSEYVGASRVSDSEYVGPSTGSEYCLMNRNSGLIYDQVSPNCQPVAVYDVLPKRSRSLENVKDQQDVKENIYDRPVSAGSYLICLNTWGKTNKDDIVNSVFEMLENVF
jgi:hypothetical protein